MIPSYVTSLHLPNLLRQGYRISYFQTWLLVKGPIDIPSQGWKIHISCQEENFQEVLDSIVKTLDIFDYSFKVPKHHHTILELNGGRYGYLMTGKVVTIYPVSQETDQLKSLCEALSEGLHYSNFYQIQTDAQYKNTPIFLRYGVFKDQRLQTPLGKKVDYLSLPNGQRVLDQRSITSYKPDLIPDLDFLNSPARHEIPDLSLDELQISKPKLITRTYMNDVYQVVYKNTTNAILKVARNIGPVDTQGRTGQDRLDHEIQMTKKVQKFAWAPNILSTSSLGSISFVIESLTKGTQLKKFFATGYGLDSQYIPRMFKILLTLAKALRELHENGIFFGDLNPNNVFFDDTCHAQLIDFELADFTGARFPPIGATGGYKPLNGNQAAKLARNGSIDVFAFGTIIFFLCTGIDPIYNELMDEKISTYLERLRKIAKALPNISTKQRQLIAYGLSLIERPNQSFSNIIVQLSKISNLPINTKSYSLLLSSSRLKYSTLKKINSQFLASFSTIQKNPALASQNTGLSNGALGMFLLSSKNYELFHDCNSLEWIKENLSLFANNSVPTLMQDLKILTITDWLNQNGEATIQSSSITSLMIANIAKLKLSGLASGQCWGLSGIGTELCEHVSTRPGSVLTDQVFNELLTRKYHLPAGGIAWDISSRKNVPVFENTFDFAYGLSGIGYFLSHYYMNTSNVEAGHLCEEIVDTIKQYQHISDTGTPIIYQNLRDKHSYPGLFYGAIGVSQFILHFAHVSNDKTLFSYGVDLLVNTLNRSDFNNHDVLNGLAGCLDVISQFSQLPKSILRTVENRIAGLANFESLLPWQDVNKFSNDRTNFLTGTLGTLNALNKIALQEQIPGSSLLVGLF